MELLLLIFATLNYKPRFTEQITSSSGQIINFSL